MKVCKPDNRRQCFPLTFRPLIWGCVAVGEGTGQDLESPRERPWLSGEARVGTHAGIPAYGVWSTLRGLSCVARCLELGRKIGSASLGF